jgi:hypothetical protein
MVALGPDEVVALVERAKEHAFLADGSNFFQYLWPKI